MCKYEMDPVSIVEDTERTPRYRADPILSTDGQTHGWMDRRMDDVKPVYPLFNFVEAGGIIMLQVNKCRVLLIWRCIQYNSDWIRTYIRINTHKRHLISCPNGRAMGCLWWGFWEKIDHILVAPHCMLQSVWRFDAESKCTDIIITVIFIFLNFQHCEYTR